MPFKIRLFLWYLKYFSKTVYGKITPQQLRKIHREEEAKAGNKIDFAPIEMSEVWDEQIPLRDGTEIRGRIYRPVDRPGLPLIVFFHGGGFVTRTIEFYDRVCRRIAATNQAMVVSVDYRLAPEHKFPGPVHDCYDATAWAGQQAERLGADPAKLIVMGDSAGGNLATVVSILARDLKGPEIRYQVLIYPSTDGRLCHPSIDDLATGYLLTKEMMIWFLSHYKAQEGDELNPLMSPFLTEDLSGLPPAYVLTAQYDPLKDEGEAYAHKMRDAGVKVVFKEFKGMIHGFLCLPRVTREAIRAQEDIRDALQADGVLVSIF